MPAKPQLRTRLVSAAAKSVISMLRHAPFISDVDLSNILLNHNERLLDLPGHLPFFATKTTSITKVQALLRKLHPVNCGKELIRLGPDGDGGYLVPNDLDGIQACFSPGVNNVAGFELDCATKGMDVFMADASVQSPPIQHPRFRFLKKFIGARTADEFLTLEDWVNSAATDSASDLLLQMDIEGYEYETLLVTPVSLLQRFRIVVIEFHYLEFLFSEPLFALYSKAFEKLLETHTCVHIHPNNYCEPMNVQGIELLQLGEFTFLRKDRVADSSFTRTFPHPLDRDNTARRGFALPHSFYRNGAE